MEEGKQEAEKFSSSPSQGASGAEEDDLSVAVGLRSWMAVASGCWCIFAGYYLAIMTASYTTKYVIVVADLGGATSVTWLPNAYQTVTLSLAAFLCAVTDVYGRRNILIVGMLIATIGCIVIATAKSIGVVIIGSFLLAGSFANQGSIYTIPSEVLPRRFRGFATTLTATSGGAGAITCYLVNGAFIRAYPIVGWRYGYYVAAGLHVMCAAGFYVFYNPINKSDKSLAFVLANDVDLVGTALLTAFATIFLIGINWGGNAYPWASAHCIATLAVGGVFLIALTIHQIWIKTDGLFNHELYGCRNFALSQISLFIEGVTFLVFLLFYPLMTNTLYETRPWEQSLRLIPFWGAFAVAAPLVGMYSRRTQDLRYPLIIGWGALTVCAIVFATLRAEQGMIAIGISVLAGAGFSAPLALLNAAAQLAVPKHLVGLATGQIIQARAFGASIGAVIFVTILTAKATVLIPAGVAAAVVEAGLPDSSVAGLVGGFLTKNATMLASTPGVSPAVLAAAGAGELKGYADAFHFGWYGGLAFLIVGTLLSVALDGKAIKRQMNWAVDNPVEQVHHTEE